LECEGRSFLELGTWISALTLHGVAKPNKERIPVQPAPGGLNDAFAGLNVAGLPAGPADPAPSAVRELKNPAKLGRVVLRRETAHRGGKSVVVVYDFATHIPLTKIENLGRKLRSACGCGGTVKGREIEIQGEHVTRVRELLEAEGFRVAGVK
jgi:translation initiation factor 1